MGFEYKKTILAMDNSSMRIDYSNNSAVGLANNEIRIQCTFGRNILKMVSVSSVRGAE